ncbi:MAG: isoleucine--tRNA ligase [Trueperaceae bacterium]
MFKEVPSDVSFPALERRVIDIWNDRNVFRRSVDRPAPNGDWVFYEGPPTANAKPGVHHVISRAYKDLFPRFKTMQGYRVGRKGGWDTHGLPVEIALEQRLGFTNKQQIEEFGIAKFNELCREDVWRNIQDWNAMTERIGFWIDLDDPYITYKNSYIESCWWIMKSLFDRGLLVEDYKTTWHSPSSNTTLASHEVSLGYKEDVEDPSIYPKFPARAEELKARGLIAADETRPVYFLAWTTTPWTLAANTGLTVLGSADYVLVAAPEKHGDSGGAEQLYWVAAQLAESVFGEGTEVVGRAKGEELVGLTYQPLLKGRVDDGADLSKAWRVVSDDFVTLEDGTGIVHVAPAYGDLDVGRKYDLPTIFSVDLTGGVMPEVRPYDAPEGGEGPYAGVWFKEADDRITADLTAAGLMYRSGTILHTYPMNWRDGTPLMNVAKKSWYIRTTAVKDHLLENNDKVGWHPDHVRTGRFGKWLENNIDWALSRERFWGATMPIWQNEDGSRKVCVGSVAELEELTGRDLSELDLHRPYVDEITFELDGETMRRVPYTVDVWFESGAMPYAQWHYMGEDSPPEVVEQLKRNFPADYICEAIDQTRGWFYSLHALGTLLTDPGDPATGREPGALAHMFEPSSAFKNLNVLGHIVDEKGEKMSKSKGNTVDPWTVLDAQGADALRWYLYSVSPDGATKRFSAALVDETLRDFFMTLWNVYGFFVLYANLEEPDLAAAPAPAERPLVDRWLVSRLATLTTTVTAALEDFDPTTASRAIRDFVVDELSNWYVRRNRRRFWRSGAEDGTGALATDSLAAYATLHEALVTVAKLMAPMAPFTSEALYQNLVLSLDEQAPDSVHLAPWPVANEAHMDADLEHAMRALIRLVELGRSARAASGVKLRQPLPEVLVRVREASELEGVQRLADQLLEELNVKAVRFLAVEDTFVDYTLKPNLPRLGKRVGKLIPQLRAALAELDGREVAANVAAKRNTVVQLADQTLELEPEDLLLDPQSPEGYAAVEERGYLVALDTRVSAELRREGLVRDAVRLVQNGRKSAGLEVSDRIALFVEAEGQLLQALEEHSDTLAREVLAVELTLGSLLEGAYTEETDVDGERFAFSLRTTSVREA